MKRVLIFGGYGFIGSHLYEELKKKYKVFRYTATKKKKIKYNYKNFYKLVRVIRPHIIFFLSGTSNPDYNNKNYLIDFKKTNLVLQSLLFSLKENNFKGKLFYFSTIGVYGSNKLKTVKEKNETNPESFYTLSKSLAEKQCEFFSNNFNLNIIILRVCSIFGPRLKRQIIYKIIKELKNNKKNLELSGKLTDKREFLFVSDLIVILKKLINSKVKNETLNIGSNKQYFIKDIIKVIQKLLNKNKSVTFLNKINTPILPLLNNKKLYKFIKTQKKFDIEDGLKKTIIENN